MKHAFFQFLDQTDLPLTLTYLLNRLTRALGSRRVSALESFKEIRNYRICSRPRITYCTLSCWLRCWTEGESRVPGGFRVSDQRTVVGGTTWLWGITVISVLPYGRCWWTRLEMRLFLRIGKALTVV